MNTIPRYAPQLPLPPYAYVPGIFPHPISDAGGHMHEGGNADLSIDEETAYGFDLFNRGYYWEAHEAWERRWVAENRTGDMADVLKGLIKLAAAGVKAREGKPEGVRRHGRRAEELFRQTPQVIDGNLPAAWALECGIWEARARNVQERAEELIDTCDESVVVIFDFQLQMPDPPAGSFVDKTPC